MTHEALSEERIRLALETLTHAFRCHEFKGTRYHQRDVFENANDCLCALTMFLHGDRAWNRVLDALNEWEKVYTDGKREPARD